MPTGALGILLSIRWTFKDARCLLREIRRLKETKKLWFFKGSDLGRFVNVPSHFAGSAATGLKKAPCLSRHWPKAPVVMLSSQAEPQTVRLARGAVAFVFKAHAAENIVSFTTALTKDEVLNTPDGAESPQLSAGSIDGIDSQRLTAREAEVLNFCTKA